jgi:outer membrane protein OmpA-like peptidoglycan-associated protein
MKNLLLFLPILLLLSCGGPLKEGLKSFKQAEYHKAIGKFKEVLATSGDKAQLNMYIGESYRKMGKIGEAEAYYRAALDANSNNDSVRFFYGYALKANGKYKEAEDRFNLYAKSGGSTEFIKRAKTEAANFKKVNEILTTKTYFEVSPVNALNTEKGEFAPVIHDDELYFSGTLKEGVYDGTGSGFAGIYFVKIADLETGQAAPKPISEYIDIPMTNEASPAFAHDGSFVIFARSNAADGKKGGSNEVDLYISQRNADGSWGEPELMAYPININKTALEDGNENLKGSTQDAWTSCPEVSPDGKRLYFASNRKGGYGGTDIWVADIAGARFRNVRNAGRDINTSGNELFPFVAESGNLYFASDGHPGLGGLDLFEAERRQGKITVKNLGVPMNSQADDFGMFMNKDDKSGYLTSNRAGGKGDDDIYFFKDITPETKIVNYFLTINVVGIDPTDKEAKEIPLSNAKVEFFQGTERKKSKITDFTADNQGKTTQTPVKMPEDYVIKANAGEDYFVKEMEYTTAGKLLPFEYLTKPETDTTLEAKIILEKIVEIDTVVYEVEINFGFNQANIRLDAARELDKFVIFLQENPQIDIELGSHTDAVGTDDRNQILSQRRADSTVAYLESKGISPNRMKAVGYGESRLKVKTQEPEERNRRTEFKVTRIVRGRKE